LLGGVNDTTRFDQRIGIEDQMLLRTAVAFLIAAGTAIVATPIVMRLWSALSLTGLILGPALGVMAGVLWASASSATVSGRRTNRPRRQRFLEAAICTPNDAKLGDAPQNSV
jgi:hypothetical protein